MGYSFGYQLKLKTVVSSYVISILKMKLKLKIFDDGKILIGIQILNVIIVLITIVLKIMKHIMIWLIVLIFLQK